MSSSVIRRGARSLLLAAFLSIVLAGQALGAGWSSPIALTSSGKGEAGGLVTLGTSIAVAAYVNNGRIVVRRSTSSGATWASPLRLSDIGSQPAIAGRGKNVDVVWVEGNRVRYARSTNSGSSFGAATALSPTATNVTEPSVGRGPNGLVVVAWMEAKPIPCCDGPWNVRVRVSTNGGTSFRAAQTLSQGWEPVVAAGKGVAYVAYEGIGGSNRGLHIRRTLDGGASWKPPAMFAWQGDTLIIPRGLTITAAGRQAYVAYHDVVEHEVGDMISSTTWIRYHRTASKGKSWSAVRNLTPAAAPSESEPVISLKGGVVRAAYTRHVDGWAGVYYRQGSDGKAWSAEQQVTQKSGEDALPAGVGYAGRAMVLYTGNSDVFVRSATP